MGETATEQDDNLAGKKTNCENMLEGGRSKQHRQNLHRRSENSVEGSRSRKDVSSEHSSKGQKEGEKNGEKSDYKKYNFKENNPGHQKYRDYKGKIQQPVNDRDQRLAIINRVEDCYGNKHHDNIKQYGRDELFHGKKEKFCDRRQVNDSFQKNDQHRNFNKSREDDKNRQEDQRRFKNHDRDNRRNKLHSQDQLYTDKTFPNDQDRYNNHSNHRGQRFKGPNAEMLRLHNAKIRRLKEEKSTAEARVREDIRSAVVRLQEQGRIQEEKFNVVHFNILTKTDDNPTQYLPCEMGLVQFSLENGIEEEFHSFLLSMDIPVGYSYQIREDAEKTHQLDLHSAPLTHLRLLCEDDPVSHYTWILNSVVKFIQLQDGEELPPLYTLSEDIEKVEYILRMMVDKTGFSDGNLLKVFPLDDLFYRLCLNTPKGEMTSDSILCQDKLEQELYFYTPNLACQFHDSIDQPRYCSLMGAKRWAFIICEECCPFYDIELRYGRHLPVEVEKVDRSEEYLKIHPGDMAWDPTLPDAAARSRYVEVTPTNDFGAVKSRSIPAGVVINNNPDWAPVIGCSKLAIFSDRKRVEEQYLANSLLNQNKHSQTKQLAESFSSEERTDSRTSNTSNSSTHLSSSPTSLESSGMMTSPFARGRGMPHLSANMYDDPVGVYGSTDLKNPFSRGRGFGMYATEVGGWGSNATAVGFNQEIPSAIGRGFSNLKL